MTSPRRPPGSKPENPGTPTPAQEKAVAEVFALRIQWIAARKFLEEVLKDRYAEALDYGLRSRIKSFLDRHPPG